MVARIVLRHRWLSGGITCALACQNVLGIQDLSETPRPQGGMGSAGSNVGGAAGRGPAIVGAAGTAGRALAPTLASAARRSIFLWTLVHRTQRAPAAAS